MKADATVEQIPSVTNVESGSDTIERTSLALVHLLLLKLRSSTTNVKQWRLTNERELLPVVYGIVSINMYGQIKVKSAQGRVEAESGKGHNIRAERICNALH